MLLLVVQSSMFVCLSLFVLLKKKKKIKRQLLCFVFISIVTHFTCPLVKIKKH